jgi:dephospho-CoA kinase
MVVVIIKRKEKDMIMFVIGVTGLEGSGKSTVSGIIRKNGAKVVDCDRMVHGLYRKDSKVRAAVKRLFGSAVFRKGRVDRSLLAKAAFSSRESIRKLNEAIHPKVYRITEGTVKASKVPVIVDAPLLFEAGMDRLCDFTIYVKCAEKKRYARLRKKGVGKEEVKMRESFMAAGSAKAELCDAVIDNSGPSDKTKKQIESLICALRAMELMM